MTYLVKLSIGNGYSQVDQLWSSCLATLIAKFGLSGTGNGSRIFESNETFTHVIEALIECRELIECECETGATFSTFPTLCPRHNLGHFSWF